MHWPTRSVMGSSPLTRGKRSGWPCPVARGRLIPAHAGKTMVRLGAYADALAHPRSRGENWRPSATIRRPAGSSPLTRGKPLQSRPSAVGDRLIPAHAGKTGLRLRPSRSQRAHPRSRGENAAPAPLLPCCRGSSPLTRGKPHRRVSGRARPGLIPAHAGKTGSLPVAADASSAHPRSRGENPLALYVAHDV